MVYITFDLIALFDMTYYFLFVMEQITDGHVA